MAKLKKKILITGGSKGIGLELVKYFIKKNFSVTVLSRSFEQEKIRKKINFLKCDVLTKNEFKKIHKKLKSINPDIIIHCIGGGLGVRKTMSPIKDWNKVFDFNVGSSIEINNNILSEMIKRKKKCQVIHISSSSTLDGGPDVEKYGGAAPYVCSKSFLNIYIKLAARELKQFNISITGFLPGPILLKHKHWFKLKTEKPKIFNEFKSDYLKGRNFLSPKKVAKKIISCYEKGLENFNGLLVEIKN